ncbi:hypothetical protein [Methylobacterium dankookense]|uniref:Uncharacterized protein n=1 Tax=Methylobacterium dankookense TaxID=560405 RepID=A0A564G6C6_9HYPH|nr:hypothetical protein [Methylobacterium dankookense]GJD59495.1 hypothetical protein IFDJLNFL_5423 [Methylobacterium dankookense]VUF16089.1 hypothetical protein MTDSW087_05840 [Methylobacterium dankookense]
MSDNRAPDPVAGAAAFIFLGFALLSVVLFAVAALFACIMTGFCVVVWYYNTPITICGETLTPDEAKRFVVRGVAGALIVPGLALFVCGFYGVQMRADALPYLAVGGYVLGSLVVGYFVEKARLEAAQQQAAMQVLPPPEQSARTVRTTELAPLRPESSPDAQPQPFRFATWDDEEELRK